MSICGPWYFLPSNTSGAAYWGLPHHVDSSSPTLKKLPKPKSEKYKRRLMLCSHLTSAFASTWTSLSNFNIASIVTQTQTQRSGVWRHSLHQHLPCYLHNIKRWQWRKRRNESEQSFMLSLFLPPANEVCEGYAFTPVCQSFCSQGGVPGQVLPGRYTSRQAPPWYTVNKWAVRIPLECKLV